MNIDTIMFLLLPIFFFVISFLFVFHTEKSVNYLAEKKRKNLKSQGYSNERIDELTKPKDWYLFYKLLGVFGLIVTSVAIITSLKHFYDYFYK